MLLLLCTAVIASVMFDAVSYDLQTYRGINVTRVLQWAVAMQIKSIKTDFYI